MPTDTIPALVADVASIDWNDLAAVAAASDKLLTALDSDRTILRELAERALHNPDLLRLCEHYDILDKIVLHNDPSGWRIRLHVFLPGYFDRPHNHRWTYSSRILHGSYTHTLYGNATNLRVVFAGQAMFQPERSPASCRPSRQHHLELWRPWAPRPLAPGFTSALLSTFKPILSWGNA